MMFVNFLETCRDEQKTCGTEQSIVAPHSAHEYQMDLFFTKSWGLAGSGWFGVWGLRVLAELV